ncbi:MAG: DUF5615 family PIN-like protein [Acidobacteriota bacterium]|nr:DUF5615 family PIN-like protein [Acidobacteriota bacterium]
MLFYADENFPLDVVIELRGLGHDVLTALEDERANQSIADEDVLARAVELGRTVLTINRQDFKRLHRNQPAHAGICICTFDSDFARQARRIDETCRQAVDANNQLIRVYRPA